MLIFDIETDGLLDTVSKIYCLSIYDTDDDSLVAYPPDKCEEGVRRLLDCIHKGGKICGHNIINYDIPALSILYPWFKLTHAEQTQVVDTLVLARLIYSNIETYDIGKMKNGTLPSKLYKSHKLEAWGYRLGVHKGEYGKQEEAWNSYNEDMLEYNKQDVVVTVALYKKLAKANYSERAIELEHKVAWLMAKQERNGFPFDVEGAEKLEMELRTRSAVLDELLRQAVPPIPDKVFIPKRDNKTKGYKAGVPIQRFKSFNPNSRKQIEYVIRDMYKYNPDEADLYDIPDDAESPDLSNYRLKIDEETFNYIAADPKANEDVKKIAGILAERLLLGKRLGQLADGHNAWLKEYSKKDKRMHGRVITNGTVSGRAAHANPNVAQVPAIGSPYGKECRALFNSGDWYEVGIDASGLELRCLAHYMYPYDDGAYAHEVLNGDIHTANQKAAGLPTRQDAKRFIYAFLYGAGDAKIGKLIGGDATDGKRIKNKFLKATPAIKQLREAVQNALVVTERGRVVHWKRHYLRGLDGRLLYVRSPHSALNLLLQSAGAVVCKYWITRTEERMLSLGYKHDWNGDFAYMAWIHDEMQVACRTKEIADVFIREAIAAMKDTQKALGFRIQLDAEGMIGKNWADCH